MEENTYIIYLCKECGCWHVQHYPHIHEYFSFHTLEDAAHEIAIIEQENEENLDSTFLTNDELPTEAGIQLLIDHLKQYDEGLAEKRQYELNNYITLAIENNETPAEYRHGLYVSIVSDIEEMRDARGETYDLQEW